MTRTTEQRDKDLRDAINSERRILVQRESIWIGNLRKCRGCEWQGRESECGFGHNDFYCPACGGESLGENLTDSAHSEAI